MRSQFCSQGYWTFDWTDSYVGLANITEGYDGVLTLGLNPPTKIKPHARFYGVNLLCELDKPNE